MKVYRFHPCGHPHPSWPALAACIWPHATVTGDGPYAAASCGARAITLYPDAEAAQARTRGYDRDGCRPRCHRHHHVIDVASARPHARPPKATTGVITCRATTPAAAPTRPICGRPRTNGEPCRRPPGWGADTPGTGPCRDHGGSISARLAAKEHLVQQALTFAQLAEKARTAPLTAAELRQAEACARDVLTAHRARRGSAPVLEVAALGLRSLGLLASASTPGGEAS